MPVSLVGHTLSSTIRWACKEIRIQRACTPTYSRFIILNVPELTRVRTFPANQAFRRMLARMPFAQRRAWGLRLQAIKGGRAAQRNYRMRGVDPCAIARAAKARKREQAQATRSKVLDVG